MILGGVVRIFGKVEIRNLSLGRRLVKSLWGLGMMRNGIGGLERIGRDICRMKRRYRDHKRRLYEYWLVRESQNNIILDPSEDSEVGDTLNTMLNVKAGVFSLNDKLHMKHNIPKSLGISVSTLLFLGE